MIWLLTWAVLFVVVIYSPIGSPELYRQDNYIVYNQGVNFGGGIANAPKMQSYQQSDGMSMTLPSYTSTTSTKTYSVNQMASPERTIGQASYRVSATVNNKINTRTTTIQNHDSAGAYTFMSSRGKRGQEYSAPQTVDVSSLSTDLAINNDPTTTRQLVGGVLDGGTDPVGDPTGPPIPVGDGFLVLLVMVAGYTLWKRKALRRTDFRIRY